jgi:predicted ArsR family transcriptional regulator
MYVSYKPSIQERVRECLREGPTTAPEVAATVQIPVRNAHARLQILEKQGRARRIGEIRGARNHRTILFQGVGL